MSKPPKVIDDVSIEKLTGKAYTVAELRDLWDMYHDLVHEPTSGVPCDACPGDVCYTDSFLDWLEGKTVIGNDRSERNQEARDRADLTAKRRREIKGLTEDDFKPKRRQ